jgi:hypothetical protein
MSKRDATTLETDRALSIRQPWAELILLGRKQYELRKWQTHHRGPLLIHAAKTVEVPEARSVGLAVERLQTSAIIGQVDVVDCRPFTPEIAEEMRRARAYFGDWHPGLSAWRLARPIRLAEPSPYRGMPGIFRVSISIG